MPAESSLPPGEPAEDSRWLSCCGPKCPSYDAWKWALYPGDSRHRLGVMLVATQNVVASPLACASAIGVFFA